MHTPLRPNASRRDLARFAAAIAVSALVPVEARAGSSFDVAAALAHHPIIGRWLAVTALGPADLQCDAGGEAFITWPHSGDHETTGEYYEYFTSASGVWRPTSATEFDMAIVVGDTDEAGLVTVNLPSAGVEYQLPFGGTKGSSFGPKEQGPAALDFYADYKTVYLKY